MTTSLATRPPTPDGWSWSDEAQMHYGSRGDVEHAPSVPADWPRYWVINKSSFLFVTGNPSPPAATDLCEPYYDYNEDVSPWSCSGACRLVEEEIRAWNEVLAKGGVTPDPDDAVAVWRAEFERVAARRGVVTE